MRALFIAFFTLLVVHPFAQVNDDFNDGDFTNGTLWSGTDADFIVNASNRLQLNSAAAGQSYLSTSFTETSLDDKEWRFYIRQSFAGSGNNYSRVYLTSNQANLSFTGSASAGANGYFLLFGEAGSEDAIRLFRDGNAGDAPVEIATGPLGQVAASFTLIVRVTRDADGNWEIFTAPEGSDDFVSQATGTDATFTTSSHLGVVCTYTISNATNFFFDDFFFDTPEADTEAPTITAFNVSGDNTLLLSFSETLDQSTAENAANYTVDGGVGNPVSAVLSNGNSVDLTFAVNLPVDVNLNLSVSNVTDLAGNAMVPAVFPFLIPDALPIVNDDFSDGDFTNIHLWTGTDANFFVNVDEVQLNAPEAGQSYLSTAFLPQSLNEKEWRFRLRQDFAGSSSNFSRVYLAANQGNLSFTGSGAAGVQGYFLRFGETGSDDAIRLFRDDAAGNSPVELLAGNLGFVASAFNVDVRVTRDASGNWQLFAGPAGGVLFFQGEAVETTYSTASHIGFTFTYTASNVAGFRFDDVYFGPIVPDETAPELLSASAEGENTVTLSFNEPLDAVSAGNALNFSVSNGVGTPVSAVQGGAGELVTLTFATAFPENTLLTVTASGIADLAGNTAVPQTAEFIYIVAGDAQSGDVVINEILADPTPAIGLPEAEFIELFNASESVFDLGGWVLVNTTTARSLPSFALLPGQFVIVCSESDAALFAGFGSVIGLSGWVALTNVADSLTLLNPAQEIIDIVSYSTSWYGNPALDDGGITLERINPFANCSGSFNWTASSSFTGGTPGAQNSVFNDTPDTEAPEYTNYAFINPNTLIVNFNEPLNADIFNGSFDYLLAPDLGDANVVATDNLEGIRFIFDTPFEVGTEYLLTLIGIADCEGNSALAPIDITIVRGAVPEPGDLIINEIMASPSASVPSSPNAEYVEIFNRSGQLLDLRGVRLESAQITQSLLIEANGYAVLTRNDDLLAFSAVQQLIGMDGFPQLTDAGRTLTLFVGELQLDRVSYTDAWYNDPVRKGSGYSLERINPDHPCSDQDNWRASQADAGHTAGAQNSVFSTEPDNRMPELVNVFVTDALILDLEFNKQLDPQSVNTVVIDVATLSNGVFSSLNYFLASAEMTDETNRVMRVQFTGGFEEGTVYVARVSSVTDCWGNEIAADAPSQQRFAVPEIHQDGDLIINEILFNPYEGGTDYVEIYNRSSRNISLAGWQLARESAGDVLGYAVMTNLPYILYPGEYIAFSESRFGVLPFYPDAPADGLLVVDDVPTYNNGEGVVILAEPNGDVHDRIAYTEDMHYPLLRDVKGVSLERIDFERDTDDLTNWHSAAESVNYGTPGYTNSQVASAEGDGVLSVSPEVFSPDNDGFDDVCIITYTLPREGFTVNVQVYDDFGRPIRQVTNNVLAATEGSFSWDGFTDGRQKAGIGMYIVFLEAFHPDGEVIQAKAVAVLGHLLD
ncbi:MAG: lamin tail domain-containing protein [Flavobacteriales bacterium]